MSIFEWPKVALSAVGVILAGISVVLARIRGFLLPRSLEREFDQELEAHLAMAEDDKIRQGLTPAQARRAARLELGNLTALRESGREARGLPWLGTFWLDLKLGLRMLRKSWGLTLVGGLAMTIAIGVGTGVFALLEGVFWPKLPLDEGDRVVALQTWDERAHRRHDTTSEDLARWRSSLRSVEDVGAFQTVERALRFDEAIEPVFVAEMTATGFHLARVPPLLGRVFDESDAREGAEPVLVIGYEEWHESFSADPDILGHTVRLGGKVHTVIGVMPEGFEFPVNHRFWTPLRMGRSPALRDAEPTGAVFARLRPGVTRNGAQAELETLGLLAVPDQNEQLLARVVPYTFAFTGDFAEGEVGWLVRVALFLVTLLLIPPCANIAILVYARTVTRQAEFAARYALGANRTRIVSQIFVEVLVLSLAAAAVALVLVRAAGLRAERTLGPDLADGLPFWMDFGLSAKTVVFSAGLAVIAALIAGVLPALKATGPRMQAGLRALGGGTGLQLGATWTALVVAQVALSIAALPLAIEMGWGTLRSGMLGPGFAAEEYLTARLEMDPDFDIENPVDRDGGPFASRFGALEAELGQRLLAEPGVAAVSVAAAAPGAEPWVRIEVEGSPLPEDTVFESNHLVRFNQVDDAFFDVFQVPVLTGRAFEAGDFGPARNLVIVNQTFAQLLLGDGNPLGRRVRRLDGPPLSGSALAELSEPSRWYEIVGVVADLPRHVDRGTMYHPAAHGEIHPATLALHVGLHTENAGGASVADRLREVTTALDPTLRIEHVLGLDEIYRQHQIGNNVGAMSLAVVTLSVLLLSAAGIYALMSFTVNQRRREIGIRTALGAQPLHLLGGIMKRAMGQLAVGAATGILLAILLDRYMPIEEAGGWNVPGVIPAAAAFMALIGLLATTGPARRGLRVEPTEALKEG